MHPQPLWKSPRTQLAMRRPAPNPSPHWRRVLRSAWATGMPGVRRLRNVTLGLLAAACAAPHAKDPAEEIAPRARPFHLIAHRGASAYAPENTLPAFQQAWELGVQHVELDIGISSDGALLLFHDSTLDAKTNLSGPLSEYSRAELESADIGSWFDREHPEATESYAGTPLLALDDLFAEFGSRFHYHVEIKGSEASIPHRLLESIRRARLEDAVTVTSFHITQLEALRALDPRVPLTWLLDREAKSLAPGQSPLELREQEIEEAAVSGFSGVAIRAPELSAAMVDFAHARGLRVRAWGVRDDAAVERVLAVGADGMTVDWPDRVQERVQGR